MKAEFFKKDAPKTVKPAKSGFYDGLTFHCVIPGFVMQGGYPNDIGDGGLGYKTSCELDGDNRRHDAGALSIARAKRNTGGSQFFIRRNRENAKRLDRRHTVFGKAVEELDIIPKIKRGDKMDKVVINEEA